MKAQHAWHPPCVAKIQKKPSRFATAHKEEKHGRTFDRVFVTLIPRQRLKRL